MSMYLRGKTAELELARKLWKYGYAVVRGPASGRKARKVFYPDIFAAKNNKILVIEVKLRKHRDTIHLKEYTVRMLREYARRSGGKAYVAVKISEEKAWYFFPIEELEEQVHNGRKRYVITVNMYSKARKISDIV